MMILQHKLYSWHAMTVCLLHIAHVLTCKYTHFLSFCLFCIQGSVFAGMSGDTVKYPSASAPAKSTC